MEQYNGEPGALRGACPVLREDCATLPPKGGKAALSYSTRFPTLRWRQVTGRLTSIVTGVYLKRQKGVFDYGNEQIGTH